MCLALGMSALDDTVVNMALPSLQASLSMSVSGLQWILNAYLLSIACLVLPAGSLGDIYGRRKVFLTGLSIFVVASVLVGMATSGQLAIIGRLLQGIGAAALLPSTLAILSDAYLDPKERTKAIGLWSGVAGLALIVGPALGGVLVDTLSWRSIFYLNIPLGVLTFWLTLRAVPPTAAPRSYHPSSRSVLSKQIDLPGMGLSIVALASFIVLLMGFDGVSVRSLLLLLLSVGSAIAFIFIESVSARPMLPLPLFRSKTFAAAFTTNALLMFMLVSLLFMFSLFLQQVQGYSATAAGLRFLPLNAAFILASVFSGYGSALLGWRWSITAGFMIAGIAVFSLVSVQADTSYSSLLSRLILVGFGVGFTLSPLTAAGMSSASANFSGIAAALMNTSTRLGGALGIAIQGGVLTAQTGSTLEISLQRFNLESQARQTIVAEAISHGATRPTVLIQQIANTDALTLQQVEQLIHHAFVSGLRSSLWVSAIALFIGAGISAIYIGMAATGTEAISAGAKSKRIST